MSEEAFVTPDMMIGDVVMQYPTAAEVMLSYGLHCVGCHVNAFETIGQGAMGHGMDEDDVAEMIKEINEAIGSREQAKSSGEKLIITEKAKEKITEFASSEEDKENMFLRIAVAAGGCSGFKYDLDFDRNPKDTDTVFPAGTYDIRVDPDSMQLLQGSVLDYLDGLQGSGFKIDNPNATNHCGCGKSFS